VRLHLGSGGIHLDGWVNVDRRYAPGVDRIDNIFILQHIPAGTVESIYSAHALDHADRWTYKTVLRRWFQLLKPDGEIYLSMPDFEWTVLHYERTRDLLSLFGQLYASQDYPDNVRHWIWDWSAACLDLAEAGFTGFDRFSPFADDASKLTDDQGNLRSLNIKAVKP
jgi:predicted SAM-dependent methyltransferase